MDCLTSQELFHARLQREDTSGGYVKVQRVAYPSLDIHEAAPAEVVTWKNGLFEYEGILVDPSLEDVPIKESGWFRWSCIKNLLKSQRRADQFGKNAAIDAYLAQ